MSVVTSRIENNISIITIDNPPVNALSHAVRQGLSDELKGVSKNDDVAAIIIICNGRTFCAGADISEFGKPPKSPGLPELMAEMDMIEKPLVAAVHGTALGGGFELTLCCHYRVMESAAKVGLPEVNLGLIPGAGGTQRLPRLIGAQEALDMICGGKPISAKKAYEIGIADHISKENLLKETIKYTEDLIKEGKPTKRLRDLDVVAANDLFKEYRKKIAHKSRGFLAPFAAIEAVQAASELSFDQGVAFEREKFKELVSSPQSKAQRHLFFSERAASKIPGIDKTTPIRDVKKVAIIGGGLMGCGIAINFLNNGFPVTLLEVSADAATAAKEKIENIYRSTIKKGRMSEDQMNSSMALLTASDDYNDLSASDLIIEAVFEDMAIKKQVINNLNKVTDENAIIATNTSFLDINEIAEGAAHPENVIGLHFFSPAHIMPLLEIVKTDKSDIGVIATALKLAKSIGKTPVVSGVCYGFIANRMSSCYGREAGLLLLEGAPVDRIDKTLYDFGMPMGMFSMLDMAGIDIGVMAREKLSSEEYDERAFSVHAALVKSGQKGKKTGAGFYKYNGDKTPNQRVAELSAEMADKYGVKRRDITTKEIEERCIFALINEGFKIVEEGIALRASDVDVVYTLGFGFPRYRGGPLHYAQQLGFTYILKRMKEFAKTQGDRWWAPSKMLVKLAEEEREENV